MATSPRARRAGPRGARETEPLRLALSAGLPRRSELARRLAAGDQLGSLIVRWHGIAADAEGEAESARQDLALAKAHLRTLRRAAWVLGLLAGAGWLALFTF